MTSSIHSLIIINSRPFFLQRFYTSWFITIARILVPIGYHVQNHTNKYHCLHHFHASYCLLLFYYYHNVSVTVPTDLPQVLIDSGNHDLISRAKLISLGWLWLMISRLILIITYCLPFCWVQVHIVGTNCRNVVMVITKVRTTIHL